MKILFVRHGESVDDVEDRYGGWSDFDLTPKGKEQIALSAEKINDLGQKFDVIYSSPLKRAMQAAQIISEILNLKMEVFEYVKERNTYGILSGMVKSEAKEKYPDQVENYENDRYVDASERLEDVEVRVKKALELLEKTGKSSVIVVTHGNFLKSLFAISGKKLTKKEEGSFVLCDLINGKIDFLQSLGMEYE